MLQRQNQVKPSMVLVPLYAQTVDWWDIFAAHLICTSNSPLAKYFTIAVDSVWPIFLPVYPIFAWLTWWDSEPGVSLSRLFGCVLSSSQK